MQYSIDITTEQSFRFMEFIDAKIWISKNASLCRVFAHQVTFISLRVMEHLRVSLTVHACYTKVAHKRVVLEWIHTLMLLTCCLRVVDRALEG